MLDRYSGRNFSEENSIAVATLMRDCGYACHMNYGLDGSAANDPDCAYAFCTNFGYDSLSMRLYQRIYYSDEEWMPLVYKALKNKQPILYGGVDAADYGGHAFIISGINTSGMVYVNWGWNGDADGFYDIQTLSATGILGRSSTMSFSERQMMITGFRLNPTPLPGAEYHTHIVLREPFTLRAMTNTIRPSHGTFWNMGFMTFYGIVGYLVKSLDDPAEEPVFYIMHQTSVEGPYGAGYGSNGGGQNIKVNDLKAGRYRIYFAAKADQQEEPELCRTEGGIPYFDFEKSQTGKIAVGEAQIENETTAIQRVTASGFAAKGQTRVYDAMGKLIYSAPSSSFHEQDVPGHGLMLIRQDNRTRKVMR